MPMFHVEIMTGLVVPTKLCVITGLTEADEGQAIDAAWTLLTVLYKLFEVCKLNVLHIHNLKTKQEYKWENTPREIDWSLKTCELINDKSIEIGAWYTVLLFPSCRDKLKSITSIIIIIIKSLFTLIKKPISLLIGDQH